MHGMYTNDYKYTYNHIYGYVLICSGCVGNTPKEYYYREYGNYAKYRKYTSSYIGSTYVLYTVDLV